MKRLWFIAISLMVVVQSWAGPVTEDEARQKASKFLKGRMTARARGSAPAAKDLKMMETGPEDTYFIFNVGNDEGFVVVSGDDAAKDILGYGDMGSLDPDSIPCNMRMLFNNYTAQIRDLREKGITHEDLKRSRTRSVDYGYPESFMIDESMRSKYHQRDPYNNHCPTYDGDNHCVTGCVATAMAGLMYAYQWPLRTTTEIPAYTTRSGLPVPSIPASTIDWSLIDSEYTYKIVGNDKIPNFEPERGEEIAKLMSMAGTSVFMDYYENKKNSSGAPNFVVPQALRQYFSYESEYAESNSYNSQEWIDKIRTELKEHGLVLYGGDSMWDSSNENNIGHAFLLEGYDENGLFHINFGWQNQYEKTFSLTAVENPFVFIYNQDAVFNIRPIYYSAQPVAPHLWTHDIHSNDFGVYQRSAESGDFDNMILYMSCYNLMLKSSINYDLAYKFVNSKDKSASIAVLPTFTDFRFFPHAVAVSDETDIFSWGKDQPDGKYKVNIVSRESGSTNWIDNDNSDRAYIEAWVCGDWLTFKSSGVTNFIVTSINQKGTDVLRVGQEYEFELGLRSFLGTSNPYKGAILVDCVWKDNNGVEQHKVVDINRLMFTGNETKPYSFSFVPFVSGEQELRILNNRWEVVRTMTINVISANSSSNQLEITNLNIDNGNLESSTIDGTSISGFITIRNNEDYSNNTGAIVRLEDTDAQFERSKSIKFSLSPNGTATCNFCFTNLIEGHHYVICVINSTGGEIYRSQEMLCTNDDTGETIPGNENLTSYEYWFDDDFAGRQTVSLNSSSEAINARIETDHLEDGVHRLHFRLFQSGLKYPYSSINSTTFLKLTKEKEQILEYWVDDDYEHRSNVPVETTEEEQLLTLDLSQASIGNHQLNMQLSLPGGVKSHVYTQGVMTLASGVADELEYWFDNDIQHSQRLKGRYSSSDKVYIYNTDIDVSSLSQGFHLLNMRAVSNNGVTKGSVLSCHVLKLPAGNTTKLEYWFDEDRKNHGFLTGKLSGNDVVFNENVNMNGLESGHHRLYYRSISENGQKSGAISMTPVLIKSAYAHIDSDNNKVVKYSIEIDDEEQAYLDVLSPQEEVVIPYTVDARNLSEGSHTLKARFWNTANAGVTVKQAFTVVRQEAPELTLTAEESNGLVNLAFAAVPNDLRYRIIRTDANGTKAKVDSKEGTSYPGTVSFTDNPAAGSYTYYAETVYTDFSGDRHTLQSNEVSVTVTAPQTEVEAEQFGHIIGRIVCDKNTPTYGVKVRFSDGKMAPGVYFMRNRIPVGEELTLTVEGDDTHEYEEVTVVVEEGENFVTIHGRLREEYQPNNLAYDLAICSAIEVTFENGQHHAKFCVTNLSTANKWKGCLKIDAVKTDLNIIQALLGNKPTYHRWSDEIEIKANETKELDVVLREMDLDDETNFDLFIWSVGSWQRSGMEDETKEKSLAFFQTPGLSAFPIAATFPKSLIQHDWNKEAQEAYAYLMLGLNSMTPGMEGKVGNLEPFQKEVISVTGAKNAFSTLIDWLGGKTALEAISEPNLFNISSAVKGAYDKVMSNVRPPLVQKYLKNLVKKVSSEATANAMINSTTLAELSSLTTAVTSKDRFDQSMACASMLYRLAADNTVPIASMIYTYTVAGRTLINAAKELHKALHDQQLADRLVKNKRRSQPKEMTNNGVSYTSYNTTCDFKLKVKTNGIFGGDINFKNLKKKIGKGTLSDPIKEIYIGASNTSKVQRYLFDREYLDDGIMLRLREGSCSDITDGVKGVINGGGDNYLTRFFMEIHWSNDRITYIPLNELGDGVEAKLGGHTSAEDGDNDLTPSLYTVTLTTTTGEDSMADELYLGDNEERE